MAHLPAQHLLHDWEPLHYGVLYQAPAVAPLVGSAYRKIVRERSPLETELGTWLQEDNTLAPPMKVRLRSLHSKEQCYINFTNKSSRSVQAIWLDFKGNEVAYSNIEPNTSKKYRTYVTHPWIIRDATSGERMMLGTAQVVYGAPKAQDVAITVPPNLRWSATTHAHFPDSFKVAARQLLLSHKRLSRNEPRDLYAYGKHSKHGSSPRHQPYVFSYAISRLAHWCHKSQSVSPESDMVKPQFHVISMTASCVSTTDAFSTFRAQTAVKSQSPHLGDLPSDLVVEIIKQLAPEVMQCITMAPNGHPDIMPALLPGDPAEDLGEPMME